MDHKFLWCATSIVLNKMMCNSLECYLQSKVSITQAAVHHNEYTYHVIVDDVVYDFIYKFDSNTFVAGTLTIIDKSFGKPKRYVVKRCGDAVRIYSDIADYTEIHDYNHTHLVAVHAFNNKKEMLDSVVIENRELLNDNTECCDVVVNSYQTNGIVPNVPQLHFDLFAVSGALDKFSTECPDVVTLRTRSLKMTFYSDTNTNIIIIDTLPRMNLDENVGKLTVINSDFNQEYEYTYDRRDNAYEATEYVRDRNGVRIEKRHFIYKEEDGIVTIPDHDLKFKVVTIGTNVKFVKC